MYQREKKRKFKQSYRFWFECVECGKRWSTNKGMVIFYYALSNYHPLYVDIERIIFKQDCKMCDISGEIIRSSVKKIDPIKFAERLLVWLELTDRQPYIKPEDSSLNHGPPHDKERCDACKAGECDENSIIDLGNDSSSSSSSGGGGPGGGGPGGGGPGGRGQGGGGPGGRGQGGGGPGGRGQGRGGLGGRGQGGGGQDSRG